MTIWRSLVLQTVCIQYNLVMLMVIYQGNMERWILHTFTLSHECLKHKQEIANPKNHFNYMDEVTSDPRNDHVATTAGADINTANNHTLDEF